ncbi:LAMI_0C02212g1_1 [Lachancea mirantina]|uniref:Cx9C motif-containing protein 4, mitochondrial n=1 Tax=Lachancea mirantina TaxID=1230905 RepID=A0A1G4J152_9SACH|nr:LAMI_0C02212g1_1 [Lachancea mirantina]
MPDPCKPQACAIQDCLTKANYDESKCSHLIDQLYDCCSKFYRDNGNDARSPCCPVPHQLARKLEQRQTENPSDTRAVG